MFFKLSANNNKKDHYQIFPSRTPIIAVITIFIMLFRLQVYKIIKFDLQLLEGVSTHELLKEHQSPDWFHCCFGCNECRIDPNSADDEVEKAFK